MERQTAPTRVLPPPERISALAIAKSSVCVELRDAKHDQDPTAQCEAFGFQSHASRPLPTPSWILIYGQDPRWTPLPLHPWCEGLGGDQITPSGHLYSKKEGWIEPGHNACYNRVGLMLACVDFLSQVALCMNQPPGVGGSTSLGRIQSHVLLLLYAIWVSSI